MHHIVYQSTAVGSPSADDLHTLLQQSRRNNSHLGVTGLLLYGNGSFLQVLEGEEATVRQLYTKIRADQRHMSLLTLSDGPVQERMFQEWSMGFRELADQDFVRLTGYINPYRAEFLTGYLPWVDEAMLSLFRSFVDGAGQWS